MSDDSSLAVLEPARRLAARLAHDVGKYLARTAHNVVPPNWTPELAAMLCRDLFELDGGRASLVFEDLAGSFEALVGPRPELAHARGLLVAIDALEGDARRGQPAALDSAACLALAVEDTLRAFAHNLMKAAP